VLTDRPGARCRQRPIVHAAEGCLASILDGLPVTRKYPLGVYARRAFQITVANRGGLKGSMQHWLAVYPPEFQIPMFFVAVD